MIQEATRSRVLVVEDDPAMQALLTRCLLTWGYGVEAELDGATAWSRLEAGLAVDVLLTDKNLPGMSGLELVGAARRKFPSMVTLMITADPSVKSAREAISAGVLGFLVKPFEDLTELRRELEGAVRRARQGARAANLTAVSAALRRAGGKRHGPPRAVLAGARSFDRDLLAQLLRDDGLAVSTADDVGAAVAAVGNGAALLVVVAPLEGQAELAQRIGASSPETWVVFTGGGRAGAVEAANVIWIAD